MKSLSQRQAWECETALLPRCKCRCGGILHGAARVAVNTQLSDLPMDDPHYAPPPQQPRLPIEEAHA